MRNYVNDLSTPFSSIDDIDCDIKYGNFYYFKCEVCSSVKERRFYRIENIDFICRECKFNSTVKTKYSGKNPGALKMHETMLKKYGTTSTAQFIDYTKIDYNARNEKIKKTCLDKYGVDNIAKAAYIKNKTLQTNLDRYGETSPAKTDYVKKKAKQTIVSKYGSYANAPGPSASKKKFLDKRKIEAECLNLEWLDEGQFRGKYDNGPIYYHFRCKKCDTEFTDDFHSGLPVCRVCNPILNQSSKTEKEIADYVKSIYTGTVLTNDRKTLNGKELDIFIPELKIAIEYNGTYWHGYRIDSQLSLADFKKKVEEKRLLCRNLGIRLITIDEADYVNNKEVFKRFLKDLILPRKRVFARKCILKEIDLKTAKDFCEYYHVDGYRNGSIKYGLYNNNELIVVAVFAKHKKYDYECIRLCYKTGYDVIGGWAKIIKHFGKRFLHYVNLKYFEGENKTGCGYRFWLNKSIIDRRQLQKANLNKYFTNIDNSKSDFVNCLNNGAIAIFDLGNDIRIYNE